LVIATLYIFLFGKNDLPPFEDAAMLMRYAQNISNGFGIVWNVGEKPVAGGTDFLSMLVLALFVKAGLVTEIATRLLILGTHLATIIIIYIAIKNLFKVDSWVPIFTALFFSFSTGINYYSTYFMTPVFTLFVAITWYLIYRLAYKSSNQLEVILFSFTSLILGLIRPEGVFITASMIISFVFIKGMKKSKPSLLLFILIYGIFGSIYFLWRWNYFGYPLPNPFYIKGGGTLHFSSLYPSYKLILIFTTPFWFVYIWGFIKRKLLFESIFSLIPIISFASIWILLSNEMNFMGRFQYPILPVMLISWPFVFNDFKKTILPYLEHMKKIKTFSVLFLTLMITTSIFAKQIYVNTRMNHEMDGRYAVATLLKEYSEMNFTIATTEAGILPLYSNWKAIDTWGLNDQWIAHNGGVTEQYLDKYKPELIMFHARFSPITPPSPQRFNHRWYKMNEILKKYAEKNNYILAASFGRNSDHTHYYYIRSDFPESNELLIRIRNVEYRWYLDGEKSINFALDQDAEINNSK